MALLIDKKRILEVVKNRYGSTIPVPENEFNAFQKEHEDLGRERDTFKKERDTAFKERDKLLKENETLKKSNEELEEDTPLTKLLSKHLDG